MHRLRMIQWAVLKAVLTGCAGAMPTWYTPPPFAAEPPLPASTGNRVGTSMVSAAVPPARAEARPALPGGGTLDLSLVEAARLVFENNLSLRVQRLDPVVAATDIEFERSAFDPLLTVSSSSGGRREQLPDLADPQPGREPDPNRRRSRSTREYRVDVAVDQRLLTGTRFGLRGLWRLTDSDASLPNRLTEVGVRVVQPTLRDFGPEINRTGIELATRNTELNQFQLQQAVMDVVLLVERAYWELMQAKLNYVVQAELVDNTSRRLATNIKRLELGARDVDNLDIQQDQAALANRRLALVRFDNQIQRARLQLLRLINPVGRDGYWDLEVQGYVPRLEPDRLPEVPDFAATRSVALANRPEIRQAQLGLEINNLRVRQARNALLPQLDLFLEYGPNGQGAKLGRAVKTTADFRFSELNVGGQFSWLLGNRTAAAGADRAELLRAQAERQLDDTVLAVELDVRLALQELANSAERYRAALLAQSRELEKLRLAERALAAGKPGFSEFFVIQFEDDLTNSRFQVNQALTDYLRSLSDLRRAEGTILQYRGLEIR